MLKRLQLLRTLLVDIFPNYQQLHSVLSQWFKLLALCGSVQLTYVSKFWSVLFHKHLKSLAVSLVFEDRVKKSTRFINVSCHTFPQEAEMQNIYCNKQELHFTVYFDADLSVSDNFEHVNILSSWHHWSVRRTRLAEGLSWRRRRPEDQA